MLGQSPTRRGAIAVPVLAGYAKIWMIAALSIVHGAVSGVGFSAMASALPQLVDLAMQENIEGRLLSRAYSCDALGSFVAMPVGQLTHGPLAAAFGVRTVLDASAVAYVLVVGLVLCSRSVRTLPRAPVEPAAATVET